MQPDAQTAVGHQPYFDTPERAERLQLVAHLLRNADLVPYVRGPQGAGKTRFAERLAAAFRKESVLVTLDGAVKPDIMARVQDALGLANAERADGPLGISGVERLLLLVDNADLLEMPALAALHALRREEARVVFLGARDPAELSGDWNLQLIDLPPFSERQTRDFLAFLNHAEAALLKDGELARLHRETGGQPGAILDAVAAGSRGGRTGASVGGVLPWKWLLGSVALLLVVVALWHQDAINGLFQPSAVVEAPAPAETAPAQPGEPIAIPPRTPPPPGPTAEPVPAAPPAEPAEPEPEAPDPVVPGASAPPDAPALQPDRSAPSPIERAPAEAADPLPQEPLPVAELAPAPPEISPSGVEAAPERLSEPLPAAPLEAPAADESTAAPAPPASTLLEAPVAAPKAAAADDMVWLRARAPAHYTLQLLGARDRAAIDKFIVRHELSGKYAVFARDLDGKPWYSLVYGDYPDREAALRGRARLPAGLRAARIWPRTFASVQAQLPPPANGH